MKSLFLTREQARQLGDDLKEYCEMRDSSERDVCRGFEIRFGDLFARGLQPGEGLEVHPIPEHLEITDESGD